MRRFAELYQAIDASNATNDKIAALVTYFREAEPADAAWAVACLTGRRPRRAVNAPLLRAWAAAAAGIPDWLFEESYQQVGDLAETITLLLPTGGPPAEARSLAWWIEERLMPLRALEPALQRQWVEDAWGRLTRAELLVWHKLITGAFRVGVSTRLVIRGLAQASGLSEEVMAHRITGDWKPTAEWYRVLLDTATGEQDPAQPYPFCLAYPLEQPPTDLGPITEWQAEWKWDGIRAQLVRRGGQSWFWSRGEELLQGRFPELEEVARLLPDGTVVDGEILPWRDDAPLPFARLQQRITRKTLTLKVRETSPVAFMLYDLLECAGVDVRLLPLEERRHRLEQLVIDLPAEGRLLTSPIIVAENWDQLVALRGTARDRGAEGFMLKRRSSSYGVGRRRGEWWKWKIDPWRIDAVLLYAQGGHGKRAGLYTDYTFGVWHEGVLVPFAKAYSGLTDDEIRRVDAFVRAHTLERFGPVRSVKPELVFELAFEGIQASPRHKSGIAVRFPRMARWRHDKPAAEADSLESLRELLRMQRGAGGAARDRTDDV